ncbi:myosin-17 [Quercus suber]|uniref:Myosin-17 n=1 Tax=Quercus suber TaxID=58331 RepID=A0AAW0LM92_QUESU
MSHAMKIGAQAAGLWEIGLGPLALRWVCGSMMAGASVVAMSGSVVDDGMPKNIVIGSHVWVGDPELVWIDGQIINVNGEEAEIQTSNRKTILHTRD